VEHRTLEADAVQAEASTLIFESGITDGYAYTRVDLEATSRPSSNYLARAWEAASAALRTSL